MPDTEEPSSEERSGPSRRAVLGVAGAVAGAAAVGGVTGFALGKASVDTLILNAYAFRGAHQSGIVTPQQDRLHFAAYDMTSDSRDDLVALLKKWTDAAEILMAGGELGDGATGGAYQAPPDDTGEALGLPPSGLTITFGFGPTLFTKDGKDRYGLASRRPDQLIDLPHFGGDLLDEAFTGGDLCIQACADDPQVAVHAIRNLSRIAFGTAAIRWAQLGFGRTSSTTKAQVTPRNLLGFKDGTRNLHAEDSGDIDRFVWADAGDGQAWIADGSYLVARRIRIHAEIWDRTSLEGQEDSIGRTKGSGAPLSGGNEFTEPDFAVEGRDGKPLIPADSHVALAHPDANKGQRMLRRGYNFTDGADSLGRLDAGLFFLAYVRDPRTQFVPVQNQLSAHDTLTLEYLQTTGSALFAVPGGVGAGEYVGQALFA